MTNITQDTIAIISQSIGIDNRLKFITADENILNRANSLGYLTYKIDDNTIAIKIPTETIICSTKEFKILDANSLFLYNSANEMDISVLDTSYAKDMSLMFGMCNQLECLNLSNFDTSHVENMGQMFTGCYNLKEIGIGNFNTARVENMGSMFTGCYNLKELDLSNFNTAMVTNMGSMFEDCYNLHSLDISNFNTEKVINVAGMFENCKSLEELDISSFSLRDDIITASMFNNCGKLRKLYVNSSIKDKIIAILERATIEVSNKVINNFLYATDKFSIENIVDLGNDKLEISLGICGIAY